MRFQTPTILVVLALASMICVGCGGGDDSAIEGQTSGSELEQFLEDNPEIRDAEGEEFDGEYQ